MPAFPFYIVEAAHGNGRNVLDLPQDRVVVILGTKKEES
jgi:hypothetical protein